jgi:hypothetical protein
MIRVRTLEEWYTDENTYGGWRMIKADDIIQDLTHIKEECETIIDIIYNQKTELKGSIERQKVKEAIIRNMLDDNFRKQLLKELEI